MTADDGQHCSGPNVSRRHLLGGLATTGTLGLPDEVAAILDKADAAVDESTTDPHTEATFRAFADAVIPKTPGLADERGSEHEFGARTVGVEAFTIVFLNRVLESGLYRLLEEPTTVRLATGVAKLLDAGASVLLAQGDNEDDPDPTRFTGGGTFASLSAPDRFRAVETVESLPPDALPVPFDTLEAQTGYVVQALHLVTMAGYYTEWAGYGETGTEKPPEWRYTGAVPSHSQTKYPGPIRGAADHRGYEVQQFRENDYPTRSAGDADGDFREGGDAK